jgi:putative ABC transport system substrate-binding protein
MNAGRRVFIVLTAFIIGLGFAQLQAGQAKSASDGTVYRIGFHYWKPGKIYDEAMAGIKDALELEGIRYESVVFHSKRDKSKAIENLKKMDTMGLDLIYSLSSAGTKIARQIGMKTPVIATVINHPKSLGLNQSGASSISLTGTSYYVDSHKQLDLYMSLFPGTQHVGMIYDVNNPAGYAAEHPFMQETVKEKYKTFSSVGIKNQDELAVATKKLVRDGVDIIVIPTNRLVYKNLKLVLEITNEKKIPVLSMNKQGVEYGALAGLFADTYQLGRYTGPIAKMILEKKVDPVKIPFKFHPEPSLILNLRAAKSLDYEFQADILGSAAIILQ